jgi:branched-subunit amino acid ABC-type transport system permease component
MEWSGLFAALVFTGIFAGIYALLCLGLNLQWGFTGLFNIGVAAFYATGAYTSALLTAPPVPDRFGGFDLPVPLGMLGATLVSGLLAYIVGRPTLRLREDYLAIATIGIAETLRLVLKNEAWLTNGVRGIPGIPRPFAEYGRDVQQLLFLGIVLLTIVELMLNLPPTAVVWITRIDTVISLFLLFDFGLRLKLTEDKGWFFRRYWIDLLAAIPFHQVLALGPLVPAARFARLLRLLRLGRAIRVLLFTFRGLDKLFQTLQLNLLKKSLLIALALLIFGALSISTLESGSAVTELSEGLWWSFATVVTGGFADLYNPSTLPGRVVTVGLVLLGLTVTGIFIPRPDSYFAVSISRVVSVGSKWVYEYHQSSPLTTLKSST